MLCISAAYAVMRCLSVHPSVWPSFSCILSKRSNIFANFFSPSGSHTIVFPYQPLWQYSDGDRPNRGVECRWGMKKSLFLISISLRRVLSTLRPSGVINTVVRDHRKLMTSCGVCWWQETDDEVFMTRSLNVAPKTTEQHFNCTQW